MIGVLSLVEADWGERGIRRKAGRPHVDSEDVHVGLIRPAVDALDAWTAAHPSHARRALAIRRLLAESAGEDGRLPTSNRQRCLRHQARFYELWGIERRALKRLAEAEKAK